jgi:hypothetical protein
MVGAQGVSEPTQPDLTCALLTCCCHCFVSVSSLPRRGADGSRWRVPPQATSASSTWTTSRPTSRRRRREPSSSTTAGCLALHYPALPFRVPYSAAPIALHSSPSCEQSRADGSACPPDPRANRRPSLRHQRHLGPVLQVQLDVK